jgi:hypothetical protein
MGGRGSIKTKWRCTRFFASKIVKMCIKTPFLDVLSEFKKDLQDVSTEAAIFINPVHKKFSAISYQIHQGDFSPDPVELGLCSR